MPCPFSGAGDTTGPQGARSEGLASKGVTRREFVASALAIGGTNALSACTKREGVATGDEEEPSYPAGPTDLASLPERQHEWNQYLIHDGHGNSILPRHQLLLFLDYTGSIPPEEQERESVERTFRSIDGAVQRGTGGQMDASFNEGLLYSVGYSPAYFARFDDELPDSAGMVDAERVLEELSEDVRKADPYDALILLTSDYASLLLSVEEALFGDLETLNGTELDADLRGVFEKGERRTGFVGRGLPARELDADDIPEHAPLAMGFKSGFRDNLPPEDKVTIDDGPFSGGTTQLVSKIALDLERWYEKDTEDRITTMFSPSHDIEQVGETAEPVGNDSAMSEDVTENIERDANERGKIGHSQKLAMVRDDDFDPLILRRSEGNAPGEDGPVLNFTSVQRTVEDFIETRKAMNAPEFDDAVDDENHGILDFMEIQRRATFLVPPRRHRHLPVPRPDQ